MQIAETNLRFNGSLKQRSRTDYIVLHHADASRCTVRDVHRWHQNKGWSGIGYHFFVAKDGAVYRGRPVNTVGAHCLNYNASSIGICAEGDFERESMPPQQWRAILELVRELKKTYPQARVVGHRDLMATACPGKYYPLQEIKAGRGPAVKEVASGMFKDVPDNHWAKSDIERLGKLGLFVGDEQGRFNPDAPVTRAQLAAVISRLLKLLGK